MVIGNEKFCTQNKLAYICDMKGLSERAGAKMDNNVPPAPGFDSGVICCSKGLVVEQYCLSVGEAGKTDSSVLVSMR